MSDSVWVSASATYLTPRQEGRRDTWQAQTAAEGRRGSQRLVHAGVVTAPADVAELLGVSEAQEVVVRRRIMYLDGRPCELTDTYYPAEIARGTRLAETAKIPGGAVSLLAELGHEGVRAREDVIARMPGEEEREALQIAVGEPVLQLTRVTLDHEDRPIQADVMAMPSQRQRLRYELRIG
ncbi:UTRA domain-containing protein [Streptomyces sp. 891-h]|uniref:GntR family transcriptional regulator n=1 Tax=unclassified Streptomyces TaxID=2593676 RepID=UPI001FA962EE|nr:UTRA domain-containing protein [Streptomyces sp. 891-h]UNZ19055.1 UTRA domain-containing protein [Streptomyces sp. 891-h]